MPTTPRVDMLKNLGILECYHDLQGNQHHADEATLAQIAHWLTVEETQRVIVGYADESLTLAADGSFDLYDEHGALYQSALVAEQGALELSLPLGYYHLIPCRDDDKPLNYQNIFLIIAPRQAYQPPVKNPTGMTAQLYALRSPTQAGIGDFKDLAALCAAAKRFGLDFVGINPLHALFTHNPRHASPYSPNSRLFLNPLYLSLDWLAEDLGVENPIKSSELDQLNAGEYVDYAAVWAAKQSALRTLFAAFEANPTPEFDAFIHEQGENLHAFATFEALCQHFKTHDYSTWSAEYQTPNSTAVRAFAAQQAQNVRFYQWLQWACQRQLSRVTSGESALSLGLYGDLAVGAARGSFDVWHQPEVYCLPASMGAPPDHLAPQGQNWQLPPFHPKALINQNFAPFIRLLRANMRHFGILRIDHVIGLSRLWWVAFGAGATHGAYVQYPQEALFAMVALESVRARCVVIGEDLGIVPDDVRRLLNDYGIFSYNVLYFSQNHQGFTPPEHHPTRAITVTSTHDVAPLLGYWHARDLEQLFLLKVLNTTTYPSALATREAEKALWAQTLGVENPSDEALLQAFADFGARSQSALYAVQLENLLGMAQSTNIPGVAEDYPNWALRYPRAPQADDWEHILRVVKQRKHALATLELTAADHAALKALGNATHPDPFAFLGQHDDNATRDVVRIFAPHADKVTLLCGDDSIATKRFDGDNGRLFVGFVPKQARYRVQYQHGEALWVAEDAYRLPSSLSDVDLWLLGEGKHIRPYEILGAHPKALGGIDGVRFCVWSPNAARVSVVGDFNHWDGRVHPMRLHAQAGIWELFIPNVARGAAYKFELRDKHGNVYLKADPYAFSAELRPDTASLVSGLPTPYRAPDNRQKANALDAPMSIYEVHLGSWRRHDNGDFYTYRELADTLIPYAKHMGFTHLELLPLSEFPFDGSWGYQPTALYAPTKRFGEPADLQYFVQQAHAAGLGVILDWVVGHFPTDAHGLAQFDGTALYEHQDPREGYHQDWNTLIYNFGRHEVRNFLAGNALYWLEYFGFDGLRVDAVASMIYRDYSRKDGQWIANHLGGRENLEAIAFLKHTNALIRQELPHAIMMAEESTAFPHVTDEQGLNFHYKWNMGWMNDTLRYLKEDPINRKYHHHLLTFGMVYQYSEHFILPLSHDEVVHGKGSLLGKMQGDCWQQFANLRAYYGFMFAYPAKKLLFMGAEFAQGLEWNSQSALEWHLLEETGGWHQTMQDYVRTLNGLYQSHPALYQQDTHPNGFEWRVVDDGNQSVFAFERLDRAGNRLLAISHFTPVVRENYRVPVVASGSYQLLLNSDQSAFHGSGVTIPPTLATQQDENGRFLSLTLPPLSTVYLYQAAPEQSALPPTTPKAVKKKGKK